MPIWKLAPLATSASDDAWAFTRWFGPILVRAGNPGRARQLAAERFRQGADQSGRDRTSLESPWLNDGLVTCRRVPVSTYRPEGPDQILQPDVVPDSGA
jgi:hypothetical protein